MVKVDWILGHSVSEARLAIPREGDAVAMALWLFVARL